MLWTLAGPVFKISLNLGTDKYVTMNCLTIKQIIAHNCLWSDHIDSGPMRWYYCCQPKLVLLGIHRIEFAELFPAWSKAVTFWLLSNILLSINMCCSIKCIRPTNVLQFYTCNYTVLWSPTTQQEYKTKTT